MNQRREPYAIHTDMQQIRRTSVKTFGAQTVWPSIENSVLTTRLVFFLSSHHMAYEMLGVEPF